MGVVQVPENAIQRAAIPRPRRGLRTEARPGERTWEGRGQLRVSINIRKLGASLRQNRPELLLVCR